MNKCWCGNTILSEYSQDYWKCSACNTLISKKVFNSNIEVVENEKDDLYGARYWDVKMLEATGKDSLSEIIDMYLQERVIYWLKYILKYIPMKSTIAEVGCGLGQLQYVLKVLEFNQLAFELSREICQYMQDELEINVHCGSFERKENGYQAILAFDLVEHLVDPVGFFELCEQSLKTEGIICIQTPCYNSSLSFEEMQRCQLRFAEQLKSHEHIYLYSKESIERILKEQGFSYIEFVPACFGDDYDMFLFASKEPLKKYTDKEVDDILNDITNGRIIKALIALYDNKRDLEDKVSFVEADSMQRLNNMNILEQNLINSERNKEELVAIIENQKKEIDDQKKEIDNKTKLLNDEISSKESIRATLINLKRLLLNKIAK